MTFLMLQTHSLVVGGDLPPEARFFEILEYSIVSRSGVVSHMCGRLAIFYLGLLGSLVGESCRLCSLDLSHFLKCKVKCFSWA